MPVGDHAGRGVRLEVVTQPQRLRRRGAGGDAAVQGDGVPRAELKAVITETPGTGIGAEVVEVRQRSLGTGVVVIAWRRARARAVPSPRRVVAVAELRARP